MTIFYNGIYKMSETKNIPISQIEPNKGQIEGLPKNPRFIKDARFEALKKSIEDAPEMLALRELIVYPFNNKFIAICGNMRLRACQQLGYKELPCKVLPVETPAEKLREYTIKDNIGFGADDWDVLANEWDADELADWGLEMPVDWGGGYETETNDVNEVDVPENVESRCELGDVWQLGEHRLYCGDATKAESVAKLLGGAIVDLVFTDPPYGMGKENEGILNDNLNFADLLEFNKKWIALSFENLKNNGSWYCWGIDEPLMDIYSEILKPMQKQNKITFRNLITWNKGDAGAGGVSFMGKAGLRSYPVGDEKCLFVMCGVQGFNNNKDNYDETFEPIRAYLAEQAQIVNLKPETLKEICGVGMWSHWFTKSQFGIIPEQHYIKLQEAFKGKAFALDYNDLRNLFDDEQHQTLKDAIMAKRAYFDNTHDTMTTVWDFPRTKGAERAECGNHATPKPIALCTRAILSSSRENESVLDLFGGSGSTLIACEQTGRKCYTMELDPHYCDVILTRWEKLTGKTAQKIE